MSFEREMPAGAAAEAAAKPEALLPFTQFIVKTNSRCNLACDYCYVYEMADQSWQTKPAMISPEVVRQTAARIGEHAASHSLPSVQVILHGGEPLLAGADYLAFIATQFREHIQTSTKVRISLQTNGVLLTPRVLDVLVDQHIGVSISVDGTQPDHDRHRRYRNGQGSFGRVAAGLSLLRSLPYSPLYRGLLCTVNLANDPIRTYETLASFDPPRIDFLLPHGNWTERPPGRPDDETFPYVDWLCTVFDRWYDASGPEPEVRLFDEIIQLLLGAASHSETLGLTPVTLVVVETDGSIEQVDALKSAYAGAAATGLDIERHDFDHVARHPAIRARQRGIDGLAPACQECRLLKVCGGGYYPHRYREGKGFRNPSVYCPDMEALIDHVRSRLAADLPRLRSDQ